MPVSELPPRHVKPEKINELLEKGYLIGFGRPSYTRTTVVCPHCEKSCDNANYKRWHGDNCKYKIL